MTGRLYGTGLSLLLLTAVLMSGCSSGNKEAGAEPPIQGPTRVGSESCVNQCHAATVDITGNVIAQAWANTTHTTHGGVQCEDCHGNGSLHWGLGPMPFPRPQAEQCETCHTDKITFNSTAHANEHIQGGPFGPDPFFFQGDAGTGQAEIRDVPEFFPNGTTPVTKAQHIQECSMCHNPNQRFIYNTDGSLIKPNPNFVHNAPDANPNDIANENRFDVNTWEGLQNPQVSCGSCHDAHQPEQKVQIAQRAAPVPYPIFRKFIVNPTGEQSFFADPFTGNEAPTPGASSVAGAIFQPNGTVQSGGTINSGALQGTNNQLSVELLCAACHTKSKYLYSQLPTHQENVYPQWKNSGHAEREAPAFAEFSANPAAYTNPNTGQPYTDLGHQTSYPYDMALRSAGATASLTQNAGSNNFACFKCHNGIGTIAWQKNIQGTPAAPVIFGDEPVTCISCHDSHQNYPPLTSNVRKPVMITNYSSTPSAKDPATGATLTAPAISIKGDVFLDTQPVPLDKTAVENGTICIFCHQGRESGYTLYKAKIEPSLTINPVFITGTFFNPHYLGTAAMLWAANAYEFKGKTYGMNEAHQAANCNTCHMANSTEDNRNGGHTWWPNVATCNTASCHGNAGLGPVGVNQRSENGPASPDVATYRAAFDKNNYTGDPNGASLSIAQSIQVLEQKLIAQLAARGVFYNDLIYPYFFSDSAFTKSFTAWTPQLYKSAFNLSFTIKGLPSGAESQVNVPNNSAAVHNYKYLIQIMQDSIENLTGAPIPGAVRPPGTRPAVVYGPNQ